MKKLILVALLAPMPLIHSMPRQSNLLTRVATNIKNAPLQLVCWSAVGAASAYAFWKKYTTNKEIETLHNTRNTILSLQEYVKQADRNPSADAVTDILRDIQQFGERGKLNDNYCFHYSGFIGYQTPTTTGGTIWTARNDSVSPAYSNPGLPTLNRQITDDEKNLYNEIQRKATALLTKPWIMRTSSALFAAALYNIFNILRR